MKTPADQFPVTYRPAADLVPYERNARTHGREQLDQLKGLIRLVGFTNPLLVDADGIIAGHGRQQAALELWDAGETVMGPGKRFPLPHGQIPVIDASGMSPADRRAYILADNQVALNSDWDRRLLAEELSALKAMEFDMSALGFDPAQLVQFMAGPPSARDPEDMPEQPPAVTQPGMVWLLGDHRIICGDSTDAETVAQLLDGEKPHLMVTDPPYGVNYDPSWRKEAGVNKNNGKMGKVLNDDRADWREAWALFPGTVAYVWHASLFTREVLDSLESCGFKHRSMIIWAKDRFTLGRGDYHWQHEPAWYVVKDGQKGHFVGGRSQSTVWNIPARDDSGTGHGTQKPVECMKRPIENNSKPGDAVYEPFSGSGTTIISCELTQRRCYAVELSPAYVDLAVRRWEAFTGREAVLSGDGRTFSQLATQS